MACDHVDAIAYEDYADDIDKYPGYRAEVNVNGTGDPSRWETETCAL